MRILIAEANRKLAQIWARQLERRSASIMTLHDRDSVMVALATRIFDVIILNLALGDEGDALVMSDVAAYRHPQTKIIFITGSSIFTDGSIFAHCANACACLPEQTNPSDLAALVEHHAH